MLYNKKSILALLATGLAAANAAGFDQFQGCVMTCLQQNGVISKCTSFDINCVCKAVKDELPRVTQCIVDGCAGGNTDFTQFKDAIDLVCSSGTVVSTPAATDEPTATASDDEEVVTVTETKTTGTCSSTVTGVTTTGVDNSETTPVVGPTPSIVVGNSTMVPSPTNTSTAMPSIETSTGGAAVTFTGAHSGVFAAVVAAAVMFAL